MKISVTSLVIVCFMLASNCFAQVCGCTDPLASNYNASATVNDGSCQYASTTIRFEEIGEMDNDRIGGTSGMIYWNGGYWTYNDHVNTYLYKLDSLTGQIVDSLRVATSGNYDTEEISQDSAYLYFGDFGNNTASRTNLHVLRIEKQAFINQTHTIDTIFFSYPDQTEFNTESMQTDFDCESFVVGADSIYVFTKQWLSLGTVCYAFPKTPGTYVAVRKGECHVAGLVTGATYLPEKRLVVLCGYSPRDPLLSALTPFFYLLYDFQSEDFFSGNKRKLNTSSNPHQVEAIATSNALVYYITNEHFSYNIGGFYTLNDNTKLSRLNLTDYLSGYLESLNAPVDTVPEDTVATKTYTITVVVDDPTMGGVTGGGIYEIGSTATLTAIPHSGYRFTCWNDNDTVNPRSVQVVEDATYTAYFEPVGNTEDTTLLSDFSNGTVRIYPNPATDWLCIENPQNLSIIYHIYNVKGQMIDSGTIVSGRIDLSSSKFLRGAFLLVLQHKNETKTVRFLKQ